MSICDQMTHSQYSHIDEKCRNSDVVSQKNRILLRFIIGDIEIIRRLFHFLSV